MPNLVQIWVGRRYRSSQSWKFRKNSWFLAVFCPTQTTVYTNQTGL